MNSHSIIDSISTGICVISEEFNILVWNRIIEEFTGISGKDIFGKKMSDIFPQFSEESIKLRLDMVLSGGAPIVFSSLLNRNLFRQNLEEETDKYYEVIATSFQLENGNKSLLFTVKDVSELNIQILKFRKMRDKALQEVEKRKAVELELLAVNKQLSLLAGTDPLTGLYNRRYIEEKLNHEIDRVKRHIGKFSVILTDIDHFKRFNDTYGHDCGDYVLKEISSLMKKNLRVLDTLSRWGGEEFLIVLPETTKEQAKTVAEKLRNTIFEKELNYENQQMKVTMTFGISENNVSDGEIESIIKRADNALYEGKELGRNCVIISE